MHFQLQQFVSLILLMISSWATVGGLASPIGSPQELAKRAPGDVHLYKRFTNSKWSFYDVGLGACGEWNVESDFVSLTIPGHAPIGLLMNALVAVIRSLHDVVFQFLKQFGSGYPDPHCGKTITLRYNGKTAQAKIMDRCPGCPYGGLDLSRSLFRHFAHEDLGIIYGSWDFGSGGGDNAPATTQAPAPPTTTPRTTSTPAPAPEPTTTRRTTTSPPPAPTTTQAPVTTTSSTPTTRAPEPVPTTSRTPAVNIVVSSYSSRSEVTFSSASSAATTVPAQVLTSQAPAAPSPSVTGDDEDEEWDEECEEYEEDDEPDSLVPEQGGPTVTTSQAPSVVPTTSATAPASVKPATTVSSSTQRAATSSPTAAVVPTYSPSPAAARPSADATVHSASASSSAAFLEDVVPSTVIAAAAPLPTESGTLEEKLQENWTLITQLFEMLGKLIQSLAGGEDAPAASASA